MDKREVLKSMITNLINDKPEEAKVDLHNYLTDKMREVSGLGGTPADTAEVTDVAEVPVETGEDPE